MIRLRQAFFLVPNQERKVKQGYRIEEPKQPIRPYRRMRGEEKEESNQASGKPLQKEQEQGTSPIPTKCGVSSIAPIPLRRISPRRECRTPWVIKGNQARKVQGLHLQSWFSPIRADVFLHSHQEYKHHPHNAAYRTGRTSANAFQSAYPLPRPSTYQCPTRPIWLRK